MHYIMTLFSILCFMLPASGISQTTAEKSMPIFCQEYLGQIDFVRGRITQLAEAVPQEKYNWRPAEGVRSVSEVYRHTALANYNLLKSSGFELPEGIDLGKDREAWVKATTNKEEIIASLNQSFDDVSDMVKKVSEDDLNKMLKVFGMEMSMRNFMITLLNHMHEHLGQSIAYARMNGIVPPWSAPPPPANLKMVK